MKRYFENFKSHRDVVDSFDITPFTVTDDEILFAWYGYGDYCGDAIVLFMREGKLYEVTGSHCSCDGLENQWNPMEMSWKALAMRRELILFDRGDKEGEAALTALKQLIQTRLLEDPCPL